MSETRSFHLGDILTITTGLLVSPRRMDGVYDLLNHMTGDTLWTHQLPRAANECRPWLERQHPTLSADAMAADTGALERALKETGAGKIDAAVEGWLAALVARHGESHEVRPIPREEHERIDPFTEAVQMMGSARVIGVDMSNPAD